MLVLLVKTFVNHLLKNDFKISIITRSEIKKSFFEENKNIQFLKFENIKNKKIDVLYNLAFSNSSSKIDVLKETNSLFNNIKKLCYNNTVEKLIHISSIVLNNYKVLSPILLNDIYTYSKYIQEKKIKTLKKYTKQLRIIRIGNVIGIGSPWYEQIIDSYYRKK